MYSTALGSGSDQGNGVAVDGAGAVYVTGQTQSGVFPTVNPVQATFGGGTDGFVAKLTVTPVPSLMPIFNNRQEVLRTAPGACGGCPADAGFSQDPVRYADGAVDLSATDLEGDGFGFPWGQTRSWSNIPGWVPNNVNGSGWMIQQLPYLLEANGTDSLVAVTTGTNARYFDYNGSAYQERFFLLDQLTYNSTAGEFVLTDPAGDQLRYYDFSGSLPAAQRGQFKSWTDPDGHVTAVVSHTASGLPAEVHRSTTSNGTTVTESYLYSYLTSGPNAGLLSNVTLRRQTNGGAWSTVRQGQYAYYDGTQPYGNKGDLMTAVVEDAAGNALDTNYYRYYVAGEANGYAHGLKYAFDPAAYARLVAALGGSLSSLSDAQVAPYADHYFQYDALQRVTRHDVAGMGASAGTGIGTFTYAYAPSANAAGFNSWAMKTTETLPDGNQDIVYTNAYAEPMLRVYHDATSGLNWDTFDKFDGQGRLVLEAAPSAVSGYNDGDADLLNSQNGNYQYLNDTAGLVATADFYTATTAGETTAGAVAGYFEDDKLQQGELGTAILQDSQQYFAHTANGISVSPAATSAAYRNTDGTGAETTSYAYTWFTGTVQAQSVTVTLPVISAAQNGPGVADTQTTYFDPYGRPIWDKDGDGFLTYTAYDPATGAVTKTIDDVDTTRAADFQNLPAGWGTPAGGGLHLITAYQVDALGRDTEEVDPAGTITYSTYDDPDHAARTYPGWNSSTGAPTGPTLVMREDRPGSYVEVLTMSAAPHLTGGVPDGTEAISNLQTLSRAYTNSAGQQVRADAYFNLAGVTYSTAPYLGTQNTNYYTTAYAFDSRGRQYHTVRPTGTVLVGTFDGQDRPVSTSVGTSDSNLVQTAAYVYDGGGVGDGNLTQETDSPGGGAAARVSQYSYDWRDRLVASKDGVQATEDTTTHRPITYTTYDNLDEATAVQQYDGDGVTLTSTNGVPNAPSASLLRAQSTAAYDDQGRVYQAQTFDVNQGTGAVSTSALTSNTWFNHRGLVIKTSVPGGLVYKAAYDGAGRTTVDYTTDGGGDATWADAGNVLGDNVLRQVERQYDANGNVIETVDRERFHDETATGALGTPTTAPKARVYYTGAYYDLADRPTASVDVGTNGGAAWTRPASVPAASDTVLVGSETYNAAGFVATTTDARGIVTQDSYDALGRTTQTIEAFTTGMQGTETDRTTQYAYDGDSNLLTVTALEPGGLSEQTKYLYGVTTASGSDLNSNDVLAGVQSPDPTTGQPSSTYQETYTVNALGDVKTLTDPNGTTHTYSYDVLGRQTADAVTTLAAGVDGTVRRIETAYDTGGRPYLYTSYNAASGGSVVNQVEDLYNGLGQLTTEYQAHGGAVVPGTTPSVQYAYTEMAGGANNSRLTSMTYPNGRVLNYNYNAGLDSSTSRLSSLSDTSATLESYLYLGLDTVVERDHPQTGVNLTYIQQAGDTQANTDGGDKYTGLDRFGRVLDQNWLNPATHTATDRFQYGYDRDSNPLYRNNLVNPAFGELYHASGAGNGYDPLNQLTAFERGTLSASPTGGGVLDTVAAPSHSQSWALDALGNTTAVTTDGVPQARTANQQNEVTTAGASTLTFDHNGNTTQDDTGKQLAYDAWNQLVTASSGGVTVASYAYDALGRRVAVTTSGTATDLYYSADWQVLEERVGGQARVQYVWDPAYVDALVERDRDPTGGGTLSERLYVQQDADWNVTVLVNTSGAVVERYVYDPYGKPTFLTASWTPESGSSVGWVYLAQGGRYDPATGYYNERGRDESPTLQRWLEPDPLGLGAGDTNLYRDEGNGPVGGLDPSGLAEVHVMRTMTPEEIDRLFGGAMGGVGGGTGGMDAGSGAVGLPGRRGGVVLSAPLLRMVPAEWRDQVGTWELPFVYRLSPIDEGLMTIAVDLHEHRDQLSLMADFLPYVGQIKAAVEVASGYDPITWEPLCGEQRALAAIGLIPFGKVFRWEEKLGVRAAKTAAKAEKAESEAAKIAKFRFPGLRSKVKSLLSGKDVRVKSIKEADALLEEALPNARKVTGTGPECRY